MGMRPVSRCKLCSRLFGFAVAVVLANACGSKPEDQQVQVPPSGDLSVEERAAGFVKKSGASRVIIFIHGFQGDRDSTWRNSRSHAYWPELIAKDEAFSASDVFVYGYETNALKENLSIDELSDNLRLRLQAAGIFDKYQESVFLVHSMGGVIARAFILKYPDRINVPMMYFFATPTTGSDLGNLANLIGQSPQAEGLRRLQGNLYLKSQMSSWLASPLSRSIRSYCAYETKDTKGVRVVPQESATSLCNERLDPIGEDHIRIAKPADITADSYVAFKVAYEESFANQRLVSGAPDIVLDASSPEPSWSSQTLVAGKLSIRDRQLVIPPGGVIVANEVLLEGSAAGLKGKDLTVVAGILSGGRIDASGEPGEAGGRVTLAVARLVGTTIDARGGDGTNGAAGPDGTNGRDGDRGTSGKCGAGMFGDFEGSTDGGNGTDGTDGGDGLPGGNGGKGGEIFLISLSKPILEPDVRGGAAGKGGPGGRLGQGGRGGPGGSGCSGIGGSQPDRPNGLSGKDGREGRPGEDGTSGQRGVVWAHLVDRFERIATIIPETQAIPDYAPEIRERLRQIAKQ